MDRNLQAPGAIPAFSCNYHPADIAVNALVVLACTEVGPFTCCSGTTPLIASRFGPEDGEHL